VANAEVNDNPTQPWPGADAPRHFHSLHDLFDAAKLPYQNGFRARLQDISQGVAPGRTNTYNEYTYYRMLAQLGTDSDEEDRGKINLNYKNNDGYSASQFTEWEAETPAPNFRKRLNLFTNIADRLLRNELNIRVDRIPVFTNGSSDWIVGQVNNGALYSSRIHQVLQSAANICDATYSNKFNETYPFIPVCSARGFSGTVTTFTSRVSGSDDATPVNATWLSLDELADRTKSPRLQTMPTSTFTASLSSSEHAKASRVSTN
jgi:hypothetical protein